MMCRPIQANLLCNSLDAPRFMKISGVKLKKSDVRSISGIMQYQ